MLRELTAEQQFELCYYHSLEPFGEVREDMRMGNVLATYVASKSGRKGRQHPLGEFVMYQDIREDASEHASRADFVRAISRG